MSNTSKVYEVKCPSCGAPLQMSGERVVCDYCGSVLEREHPPVQEQKTTVTHRESQVVVIQTGYSHISGRQQAGGSSCLSGLFTIALILGVIGVIGWFQFPEQTAALLNQAGMGNLAQLPQQLANKVSVTALTRVTVLPGGNEASPDFLTFAYPTGGSTYNLAYVESLSSTIRWQGPPLKESYNTKILQSPEAIYFTDETKLYAINRQNGQTLWQTSLADKLSPGCLDCFKLIGNRLVALVQGGAVQGFDAETGQLLWNQRLNSEPTARLLPADNQLLIFDRTPDSLHNLLLAVDPATGESSAPITLPQCAGEFVNLGFSALYNQNRGEVYLIFNGPMGPPCLQIWEMTGPTMTQAVSFEGLSVPLQAKTFGSQTARAILAGDKVYLSANQTIDGIQAGVVAGLNPVDGQWRVVAHALDYDLTPLATADNVLIVRAIRSRGTARDELWGIDLASGEPRWQHVLQAPRWSEELGAGDIWDWRLTPAGLAVVQVLSEPDQITLEILNPQTGVSPGQKTIPVSDSFFSDLAWTDDSVWLALRQIYKLDLASGTVTYTWP